ncbi:MAG: GxxExxY protein [Desulfovermiculus sp.]|nr:GxxExxY protein [Desulfovermiculus sp.]
MKIRENSWEKTLFSPTNINGLKMNKDLKEQRKLLYKDEVYAIIGAAFEVYNTLGPGFLEAVYQEALAIEFKLRSVPFKEQLPVPIEYKGEQLKTKYQADFLCYGEIIVEIKAQECLVSGNEGQLLNYLNGTKLPVGVLINFGKNTKLEWKRFVL